MPDLNGIEVTMEIEKIDPDIRIIVFTMHSDKEYVINLFKAGISAYVLKEDPVSDLIFAVNAVMRHGTYFSRSARSVLVGHVKQLEKDKSSKSGFESLSPRELEIFLPLAQGMSIRETARKLCISPKTVESHKYNIFSKLNASTISDLTRIAIRRSLIQP
jgi:DNA-binding NarL/FixJ family response regulator